MTKKKPERASERAMRLSEGKMEAEAERRNEMEGQARAEAAGVYDGDAGDDNDLPPGLALDAPPTVHGTPHANVAEPTRAESEMVDTLIAILRCNTAYKCHELAKVALAKWAR